MSLRLQLVPTFPRSWRLHVEEPALHRAHRQLQGRDAADEDAPEQDPERHHEEEGCTHRDLEERLPLGGDQVLRLRKRCQQNQTSLGASRIIEGGHQPQRST